MGAEFVPAWNRSREEEERGRALRAELLTTDLSDSTRPGRWRPRWLRAPRSGQYWWGADGGQGPTAGGQRGGGDRIGLTLRCPQEEEFRWLLHAEVHAVLRQLQDILKEASLRFTLPGPSTEGPAKQENFILGSCG